MSEASYFHKVEHQIMDLASETWETAKENPKTALGLGLAVASAATLAVLTRGKSLAAIESLLPKLSTSVEAVEATTAMRPGWSRFMPSVFSKAEPFVREVEAGDIRALNRLVSRNQLSPWYVPTDKAWVLESRGRLVGVASVKEGIAESDGAKKFYLGQLAVDPKFRGGTGSKELQLARFNFLKEQGDVLVSGHVMPDAQRLYRKLADRGIIEFVDGPPAPSLYTSKMMFRIKQ